MITNFEGVTNPLSDDEMRLVPYIIDGLKKRDKDHPIKGAEICERMQAFKKTIGIKEKPKLTDARLRKIVSYIRINALLPIGATSNGYFCITDYLELDGQIKSLKERADAIYAAADGIKRAFENPLN